MDTLLNAHRDQAKWKTALPRIKSLYLRGASPARYPMQPDEIGMTESVAEDISKELDSLPLSLIAAADNKLRSVAGAAAPKLLDVANQQGWFLVSPT
jgi:hypothetical protein